MGEKSGEEALNASWGGMMECRMSWGVRLGELGGKVAQNHLVFRFGGVCEGDEQWTAGGVVFDFV